MLMIFIYCVELSARLLHSLHLESIKAMRKDEGKNGTGRDMEALSIRTQTLFII